MCFGHKTKHMAGDALIGTHATCSLGTIRCFVCFCFGVWGLGVFVALSCFCFLFCKCQGI